MEGGGALALLERWEREDHANDLTRACHDTMRELAAVAGLALWVFDRCYGDGLEVPAYCDVTVSDDTQDWCRADEVRRVLAWEAPDA